MNDVDFTGLKILIVEDEYLIADDMCRMLRARGAAVVGPVSNLGDAMALAHAQPLDLAILDINLDGDMVYEAAAELQRLQVPVVFVTGQEDWLLPTMFKDVPHLEKPVVYRELFAAIKRLTAAAQQA